MFGEAMTSEELMKTDPMSEQENKPPANTLSSSATNFPKAAHLPSHSPIGWQLAERTDTFVPYQTKNQMDLPKLSTTQGSSSTSVENQQNFSTPGSSSRVRPPRRPLRPLTINLPDSNTSSSSQQSYQGGEVEEKQVPSSIFNFPPPLLHQNPPFRHTPFQHPPLTRMKESPITCVVEQEGHLCLRLR